MTQSRNYTADHCTAKALVCITYIVVGAASIETGNPYIALVVGTIVWFFGVNATAYLLETLLRHPHCHNKV